LQSALLGAGAKVVIFALLVETGTTVVDAGLGVVVVFDVLEEALAEVVPGALVVVTGAGPDEPVTVMSEQLENQNGEKSHSQKTVY
jgi:hypothetical protein